MYHNIWHYRDEIILSAFSSFLFTISKHIIFSGDVYSKNSETYISHIFNLQDLPFFIMLFLLTIFILVGCNQLSASFSLSFKIKKQSVRFFIVIFSIIVLAWIPYLFSLAPGNLFEDSLSSIGQMLEHGHPTSNHHPMFYTLLIGICLKIGEIFFNSANAGILLYSICQMLFMAACISCVLFILFSFNIGVPFIGIALIYYMFFPIFPLYAITMWKDPLYSCFLLLFTLFLLLLQVHHSHNKILNYFLLPILLGVMMTRNNGIFVVLGSVIFVVLSPSRKSFKSFILISIIALLMFEIISRFFILLWNIDSDFVEKTGIPLQQIGYVLQHNPTAFSERDLNYLYTLMPDHVWNYAYRPCLVDTIKWNPLFDNVFFEKTKVEFFQIWFHGLLHSPFDYCKAYILATFGFWKPFVQNIYGYMRISIPENGYAISYMTDYLQKFCGLSLRNSTVFSCLYIGSGTLFWIQLLSFFLCHKKKNHLGIIFLPSLINWLTVMVATPVAFSLRYVFIFPLALPLYFLAPLINQWPLFPKAKLVSSSL